jgi:outer membrane biosynthesis protein TonB
MIRGGSLSVGLHALIFGAIALELAFFSGSEPLEAPPVIPVEMLDLGDITNQKVAGEPDETPPTPEATTNAEPEPEPPAPTAAAEPEPPALLPDTNTLVAEEPEPQPEPERDVAAAPPAPPKQPERPAERAVKELHPDATVAAKEKVAEKEEKLAALDPLPRPEPKPEPKKQPEPEPEPKPEPAKPEPKPEPKKKPEPEVVKKDPPKPPKPEKKNKNLDLDRLSAKLDKLATEKPKKPRDKDKRKVSDIRIGEDGVSTNRLNQRLSVTEVDLLRSRLRQNWSPNHGAPGVERMQVIIRINLNPDGTLASNPKIVDGFDAGQSARIFEAFSESAIRAVRKSEPFPLPQDKYQDWREIEINFNLREMYG